MSIKKKFSSKGGQAVVEYLIVFAGIALIGILIVGRMNKFMTSSIGSISFELTQHLTTGVCDRNCFFDGYKNKVSN
jgi:hypothetical protein